MTPGSNVVLAPHYDGNVDAAFAKRAIIIHLERSMPAR